MSAYATITLVVEGLDAKWALISLSLPPNNPSYVYAQIELSRPPSFVQGSLQCPFNGGG
jgi:hypothetical protein